MKPDNAFLSHFAFAEDFDLENYTLLPIVSGHINNTYKLESGNHKYIVQKINTGIFKDPAALMKNIKYVTEHIRNAEKAAGSDPKKISDCTLEIVPEKSGALMHITEDGECWRCYIYIDNSAGLDTFESNSLKTLELAGAALAEFQRSLMDFDASLLVETIPSFHDTKDRFRQFEEAVAADLSGRKKEALPEVEFALSKKEMCSIIVDEIAAGNVPLRVTHNDTKLSNILADKTTGKVLCFIDLDTVMPGSALYDFGDALRSAASSGAEDEPDVDKIYFVSENFEAFCKGYLTSARDFLTAREIELLAESVIMMTFECGIRFLGDFLNGDTYFATKYPEHNLVRARTQFKLVADMLEKLPATKKIAEKIAKG